MYLVTIFWTKRPLTRHYIKAKNESQAIISAVNKGRKNNKELYDHVKSKAIRLPF